MLKPWKRIHSKPGRSFRIFSVRTDRLISPRTGLKHDFHVIESRDWVNIIPITEDRHVVMIRQYRHGSGKVMLEIPGGIIDPGNTPKSAAIRELLEETGYQSKSWTKIGTVHPNPALFNNRCHIYLARKARKVALPSLDQTEDIEVVLIPLKDIRGLMAKGRINHAIVIAAFTYYFLRYPGNE